MLAGNVGRQLEVEARRVQQPDVADVDGLLLLVLLLLVQLLLVQLWTVLEWVALEASLAELQVAFWAKLCQHS